MNRSLLMVGLCVVSMAWVVVGQQKTITISGKVIDSISGAPVSHALVLLTGLSSLSAPDDAGSFKFDSTYSNADGTFKAVISISGSIVLYGAYKNGYDFHWNYVMLFLSTSVNAPTIKLLTAGASPKDTFLVSGTVVDSVTGNPISQARVIMNDLSFSNTGDTAITNTDGTFSKQAIVSKTGPYSVLIYTASKQGYANRTGENQPSGKQVNVGTVKLAPKSIGIALPRRANSPLRRSAIGMGVFTLSGKRLYAGPARQRDAAPRRGPGVVVVRFTRDNSTVAGKTVSVR